MNVKELLTCTENMPLKNRLLHLMLWQKQRGLSPYAESVRYTTNSSWSHYRQQTHRLTSNNSSTTRISYLERQMQERTNSSVQDDHMHFEDIDIAAGSSDHRSDNQGRQITRILEKEKSSHLKQVMGIILM